MKNKIEIKLKISRIFKHIFEEFDDAVEWVLHNSLHFYMNSIHSLRVNNIKITQSSTYHFNPHR